MNSPEIKIYKSFRGDWTAETYTLGHLLTTRKHGRDVTCSARKCTQEISEHGVSYQWDWDSRPEPMHVAEGRRASRSMVVNTHELGLREFYLQMQEVTS